VRRIAHVSDLHFGDAHPDAIEPLLETLHELAPDVIAISGDLTQRARRAQFEAAAAFLARLPRVPRIAVPGNHDVPFWDVTRRFLAPLRRFDRHVSAERYPSYEDPELAIVGLNTARSLTFKNGRVNARQLAMLRARLARVPAGVPRIVVAHHPFALPEDVRASRRVGRAQAALPLFADMGVDVLLTGHRHVSWNACCKGDSGRTTVVVHAGTATSLRLRGEENSFNEVIVDRDALDVVRYAWQPPAKRFAPAPGGRVRFPLPAPG
jgi:3',5'-cyclic AMP phosphodiesterase CpdA